jgi:hypothetical protein
VEYLLVLQQPSAFWRTLILLAVGDVWANSLRRTGHPQFGLKAEVKSDFRTKSNGSSYDSARTSFMSSGEPVANSAITAWPP